LLLTCSTCLSDTLGSGSFAGGFTSISAAALTNWPGWITVTPISSTNTTGNVGTYLPTPAFSVKSNVLYLAGIVHSKASTPNNSIFTNGLSYQWTLVGRQSFNTTATPLEMLEIYSFITNVDMGPDRPSAYFTANQTGCSIGILAVSNVDVATPIVQNAFAASSQTANPNVSLSALNASGSNAVVVFAGNYTNTSNFWQASENRTEDYDLVYSTPSTGFWAGHDTNTTDNTVSITAAAGNWAIGAVEVGWLGTALPGIAVQPVAQSVVTNTTATFTCYAVGGPVSPGMSYQWTWGGTNIAGATTTAVSITPTNVSQTGLNVQCNCSNAFGGVASSAVALTVTATPAWDFVETFDAAGYDNTGWSTASGTPNADYTTSPLEGTQSLYCNNAYISRSVTGTTKSFFMMFKLGTVVSTYSPIIYSSGPQVYFSYTGSPLTYLHGSATATGAINLVAGTVYYLWLDWVAGSGANGTLNAYLATTATKPGTPDASITTGTGTSIGTFYLGPEAGFEVIMDRLIIHGSTIGSNP